MKQLVETIEKLRLRNVGLRSLTEAIDASAAQGVLVFHMFSALAEFERALIRGRTRAGLAAAKCAGRTVGRPPKVTEDDLDVARTLLANLRYPRREHCRPPQGITCNTVPISAGGESGEQPLP